MIFIYIDRVVSMVRHERITAVRQLTSAEQIFQEHFPGNPMLPASLAIEACAQAATMLLETSSGFERKAFVGFVEKAKFRHPIRPGHEMQLDLEVKQGGEGGVLLGASVLQREKKCATINLGMVTAPIRDFVPADHLSVYLNVFQVGLAETQFHGFDFDPCERLAHAIG